LKNFVIDYDVVGNFTGNGTGAAVYIGDTPGRTNVIDYHGLEVFRFSDDGAVLGASAAARTQEEIFQNAAASMIDPNVAPVVGTALAALSGALRNPAIGRIAGLVASGVTVTVDTVASLALATSISALADNFRVIKAANRSLIPQLTTALDNAKRAAAALYPWITEADIENCVAVHRLTVHEIIDASAVSEVDALVDKHLGIVGELSEGVVRAVEHAVAHDAQWALIYGRP
jgi:hypothetical protein